MTTRQHIYRIKMCIIVGIIFIAKLTSANAVSATVTATLTFDQTQVNSLIESYNKLVIKNYEETLVKAKVLQKNIIQFIQNPTQNNLNSAKENWKSLRLVYSKTEAYRFYGGPIDEAEKGPEGFINAWPVDEAYIDYVKGNPKSGIINNETQFPKISKETLRSLNEKNGETNISTGFHAIEFLLWGQDLDSKGPGQRPYTDYSTEKNAKRRAQYLQLVTDLLVEDLEYVANQWRGNKYLKIMQAMSAQQVVQNILMGMSSLAFEEMAGERMTVAITNNDQENEQDCFSDFSIQDLRANLKGISEIWEHTPLKELLLSKSKNLQPHATKYSQLLAQNAKDFESIKFSFDYIIATQDKNSITLLKNLITNLQNQSRELSIMAKAHGLELNIQ